MPANAAFISKYVGIFLPATHDSGGMQWLFMPFV
jgi:hypothetical protein